MKNRGVGVIGRRIALALVVNSAMLSPSLAVSAGPDYPRVEITPSARAHVRANTKDPGSLQFQREFTSRPGMYCGEVNGKNGFGGYSGFKRFITNEKTLLIDDGSVRDFRKAWQEFCRPPKK